MWEGVEMLTEPCRPVGLGLHGLEQDLDYGRVSVEATVAGEVLLFAFQRFYWENKFPTKHQAVVSANISQIGQTMEP